MFNNFRHCNQILRGAFFFSFVLVKFFRLQLCFGLCQHPQDKLDWEIEKSFVLFSSLLFAWAEPFHWRSHYILNRFLHIPMHIARSIHIINQLYGNWCNLFWLTTCISKFIENCVFILWILAKAHTGHWTDTVRLIRQKKPISPLVFQHWSFISLLRYGVK